MRRSLPLFGSPGHIRSRLFRDLVLLVIFTIGLLVLVNWLLIDRLKRERTGSRIATATALVRNEVQVGAENRTLNYDPRLRPWFIDAIEAPGDRVSWSAPYVFHSLEVPGITVSIAWKKGDITWVLGMDVILSRIVAASRTTTSADCTSRISRDGSERVCRGKIGLVLRPG
jgi:hypothetical protein